MKRFETPEFVEIKMDAEIGSYQEEHDQERDPFYPPVVMSVMNDVSDSASAAL